MRKYDIIDPEGRVAATHEMDDSSSPPLLSGYTARLTHIDGVTAVVDVVRDGGDLPPVTLSPEDVQPVVVGTSGPAPLPPPFVTPAAPPEPVAPEPIAEAPHVEPDAASAS